jgi:hypothetical protein
VAPSGDAASDGPRNDGSASSEVVIGETSILPLDDSENGNVLVAQEVTLDRSATLLRLSFFVTSAAGKLRLGLYDASGAGGLPGRKLAETNEIVPVAESWNEATVPSALLAAGRYWLAYLASDSLLHFRRADAGRAAYGPYPYGPMPTTFVASPGTAAWIWSFTATLTR